MKTTEFKQNYNLDRSARSPRATRKHGEPASYPIAVTADGKPFNHAAIYHFFDGDAVRTSEHLRRIDGENLGSMGLKIVEISKLRSNRDAAFGDAQKHYLKQIAECRQQIEKLEAEKTPKNRTIKYILMARDS